MRNYNDIINLPHHVSKVHPSMSMYQRAAQFAPFAALTGHGAAISETARLTDSQIEMSEDERKELDLKLALLLEHIDEHPSVCLTYFVHDEYKDGGKYIMLTGKLRKWDEYTQTLILEDDSRISVCSIVNVSCDLFNKLEK